MWRRESRLRSQWPAVVAAAFERLNLIEVESVRRQTQFMEYRALRHVALALNRLANGALYPLLAILLFAIIGKPILPALAVAFTSVLAAHLIYPFIKKRCARARPFDCDSSICSLLAPLDKHSFPSGHVMTATTAFIPLSVALPSLLPVAIAAIILIGWVRLAVGHHYPSDVVAGFLLGALISGPGTIWMLQYAL